MLHSHFSSPQNSTGTAAFSHLLETAQAPVAQDFIFLETAWVTWGYNTSQNSSAQKAHYQSIFRGVVWHAPHKTFGSIVIGAARTGVGLSLLVILKPKSPAVPCDGVRRWVVFKKGVLGCVCVCVLSLWKSGNQDSEKWDSIGVG